MSDLGRFLSAAEIAEICSVSVRTVRRWIRDGVLPSLKLGGARRVAEADLRKLLFPDAEPQTDEDYPNKSEI